MTGPMPSSGESRRSITNKTGCHWQPVFQICGYQTPTPVSHAASESWLMVEFTSVTVFLCT